MRMQSFTARWSHRGVLCNPATSGRLLRRASRRLPLHGCRCGAAGRCGLRIDVHVCLCQAHCWKDFCTSGRSAVHRSGRLCVASTHEPRAGPLRPAGCCGTQACAIVSGSAAGLYTGLELPQLRARCGLRRMCRARAGLCGALVLALVNRARAERRWGCGQLLPLLSLGRSWLAWLPHPLRPSDVDRR